MPIWSINDPNKPASVPVQETIEFLLSLANPAVPQSQTLQQLTPQQRLATNLVQHDGQVREGGIPGDPYGTKRTAVGNVYHVKDPRAEDIIRSCFTELKALRINTSPEIDRYTAFFRQVPGTQDVLNLARACANAGSAPTHSADAEVTRVDFELGSKTVHVRQCHNLNLADSKFGDFQKSAIATRIWDEVKRVNEEKPMDRATLRYLAAIRLCQGFAAPRGGHPNTTNKNDTMFRNETEAAFWIETTGNSTVTRDAVRKYANDLEQDPRLVDARQGDLPANFAANWAIANTFLARNKTWLGDPDEMWTNKHDKRHLDMYFANTQALAAGVFEHVDKDIVIVLDKNGDVLFANFERLLQTLYGSVGEEIVMRAHNIWSFFFNVDAAATQRHITDGWVRKTQPEADIARGTVTDLPNRKMCVGHYGANTEQGHSNMPPKLTFPRLGKGGCAEDQKHAGLLPDFFKSFVGLFQECARFFTMHLDPDLYAKNVESNATIPDAAKMNMATDDFLSYWAFGHNCRTDQHRDTGDQKKGLAHCMTFGNYTGGNFVVPELGISVEYKSGAMGLTRGAELNHWVSYTVGERNFGVGTNKPEVEAWYKRIEEEKLKTAEEREAFRLKYIADLAVTQATKREAKAKRAAEEDLQGGASQKQKTDKDRDDAGDDDVVMT